MPWPHPGRSRPLRPRLRRGHALPCHRHPSLLTYRSLAQDAAHVPPVTLPPPCHPPSPLSPSLPPCHPPSPPVTLPPPLSPSLPPCHPPSPPVTLPPPPPPGLRLPEPAHRCRRSRRRAHGGADAHHIHAQRCRVRCVVVGVYSSCWMRAGGGGGREVRPCWCGWCGCHLPSPTTSATPGHPRPQARRRTGLTRKPPEPAAPPRCLQLPAAAPAAAAAAWTRAWALRRATPSCTLGQVGGALDDWQGGGVHAGSACCCHVLLLLIWARHHMLPVSFFLRSHHHLLTSNHPCRRPPARRRSAAVGLWRQAAAVRCQPQAARRPGRAPRTRSRVQVG